MLYAKSKPEETIKEHTNELLERLKILKENYGEEILNNKNIEKEKFWKMLELECTYHDIGKAYTPFQNIILEKLGKTTIKTNFNNEIKHEQLSPLFIPLEELTKLSEKEEKILTQVISFHHERGYVSLSKDLIEKIIEEDIKPRINEIEEELQIPLNKNPDSYYIGYLEGRERITHKDADYIEYCIQKGILHRLDHSASAHVSIEDITNEKVNENVEKIMEEKGFEENELQKYCKENQSENLIIIGSTGMGKTEGGLLWSNGNKTFFTLPIRISINAIYDRIVEEYKYKNTGLLHSSALDYLESKETESYESNYFQNEEAKNLSKKITTCTIDQIFPFVFKYKGYEKVYATLAYSKVIIDEIQAYSPEIVAVILKGLEMINKIGGKFLVMTATLPRIYKEKLIEMGVPFKSEEFLSETKRHKIKLEKKEITEDIENIIQKSKNSKVLIIVNTVDKAIELYNKIKEQIDNVYTLHSRFIAIDREAKERNIKEFAKGSDNGIWITTQIVEASIDIDFDYLYTEMSTLDSLFQRLGRCYRKREWKKEECNVYVYTKEVTGVGYIYDKEIYEKSIELLENYNEQILSEEDKVKMVDILYSKENLEGTKFIEAFKEGIEILNNIVDYETSKKDAQKILRNIENIKVIPKSIYDDNKELFDEYSLAQTYQEKRKLRKKIEKLSTSITSNQARLLQGRMFNIGLEDIKGIDTKYSNEVGLVLKQSLEDDVESRSL